MPFSEMIGVIQSPIRFWDIKLYDHMNEKHESLKYNKYYPDTLAINSQFGFNLINDVGEPT